MSEDKPRQDVGPLVLAHVQMATQYVGMAVQQLQAISALLGAPMQLPRQPERSAQPAPKARKK